MNMESPDCGNQRLGYLKETVKIIGAVISLLTGKVRRDVGRAVDEAFREFAREERKLVGDIEFANLMARMERFFNPPLRLMDDTDDRAFEEAGIAGPQVADEHYDLRY